MILFHCFYQLKYSWVLFHCFASTAVSYQQLPPTLCTNNCSQTRSFDFQMNSWEFQLHLQQFSFLIVLPKTIAECFQVLHPPGLMFDESSLFFYLPHVLQEHMCFSAPPVLRCHNLQPLHMLTVPCSADKLHSLIWHPLSGSGCKNISKFVWIWFRH